MPIAFIGAAHLFSFISLPPLLCVWWAAFPGKGLPCSLNFHHYLVPYFIADMPSMTLPPREILPHYVPDLLPTSTGPLSAQI